MLAWWDWPFAKSGERSEECHLCRGGGKKEKDTHVEKKNLGARRMGGEQTELGSVERKKKGRGATFRRRSLDTGKNLRKRGAACCIRVKIEISCAPRGDRVTVAVSGKDRTIREGHAPWRLSCRSWGERKEKKKMRRGGLSEKS